MEFWQMAVLAPFYVMVVIATAYAMMYFIDSARKQIER